MRDLESTPAAWPGVLSILFGLSIIAMTFFL